MPHNNIEVLLEQIEKNRKQMIDMVKKKPLTDPDIIKVSQKLDELLNEYKRLGK